MDDFAAAFIRLEGGITLDFRIAWAMNMDTPGDTLLFGTRAGLRIPSTECWNGTVGGPMKVYMQFGGMETNLEIPIIESEGLDLFDCKIVLSWMRPKTAAKRLFPAVKFCIIRRLLTVLSVPVNWGTKSKSLFPKFDGSAKDSIVRRRRLPCSC